MSSTKPTIEALQKSAIGQLAMEMIQDAGGKDQILQQLNTTEGMSQLFGSISSKVDNKMRNGTLQQDTIMKEASHITQSLSSMLPSDQIASIASMAAKTVGADAALFQNLFGGKK